MIKLDTGHVENGSEMISLINLLNRHWQESKNLIECVVARTIVDGKTILAKNRDRGYDAKIKVIHELLDGVEVVYLHDELTDWSEGLNEFGVGIVNASLTVAFDEKEGAMAKKKLDKGKAPKVSFDGLKIRTALSKRKLVDSIRSIISFVGEDKKDIGIKGHTIVSTPTNGFIIEMTSKDAPVIIRLKQDSTSVRTNHGIAYPNNGYTDGIKRTSSLSRQAIAKDKLKNAKSVTDVLNVLAHQYTKDPFLNPYRRDNKFNMQTTSQVMYNLNDLEFVLRWDEDHSEFLGIINLLPKGYDPKIKIKIQKTT